MVTMTSNTTPAPYVASASNEADADHRAFRAFDNDANYAWMTGSGSGPPWWLKFDWGPGSGRVLSRYTVACQDFYSVFFYQRCPANWEIQGSNDDLTWDVLDTVVGQTGWPANQVRVFECDVQLVAYRYFRMYITLNGGAPWADIVVVSGLDLGRGLNKFY